MVTELDGTRPATSAMNGGWLEPGIADVEALIGVNYYIPFYDRVRKAHPDTPLFASETASTYSTRGVYENDKAAGWVSAYDVNYPGHGQSAEGAWKPVADRNWMAGAFVWTGFDYRGEPSPYGWPSVGSQFGIMDSCGFPKDVYYYYQAAWKSDKMVHLLPHWNWRGREGKPISVWAFSNADQVELFLNGRSLGRKVVPHLGHVEWMEPFRAGRLAAVAYSHGKVVARDSVETTGRARAIRLRPAFRTVKADNEDLIPVEVDVVDEQGRIVPTGDNEIDFTVSDGARIAGVANGDPSSHEPDVATRRHAFNGRCLVLVSAGRRLGRFQLIARSKSLTTARVSLTGVR
jgi:beta-galactosidase